MSAEVSNQKLLPRHGAARFGTIGAARRIEYAQEIKRYHISSKNWIPYRKIPPDLLVLA